MGLRLWVCVLLWKMYGRENLLSGGGRWRLRLNCSLNMGPSHSSPIPKPFLSSLSLKMWPRDSFTEVGTLCDASHQQGTWIFRQPMEPMQFARRHHTFLLAICKSYSYMGNPDTSSNWDTHAHRDRWTVQSVSKWNPSHPRRLSPDSEKAESKENSGAGRKQRWARTLTPTHRGLPQSLKKKRPGPEHLASR